MDHPGHRSVLVNRLRWLMFFRVIIATFLLGTTMVVQFRRVGDASDSALTALYTLIGFIYCLTFVYAIILPRLAPERVQAYIQTSGDVLITTAVIYITGGLESTFSFMYILVVIVAGFMLKVRGAVVIASLSAILYGALLDLHYYRYIQPFMTRISFGAFYEAADILNTILINMIAFYMVAFLSGFLSRQAEESRIMLAESQSDLERLEDLNERIIESIDSGLMTLGRRGEILSFNKAAEEITGYEFERVRRRSHKVVFPDLNIPVDSSGFETRSLAYQLARADGQDLELEMTLLGLSDREGNPRGRLLVFQDKTLIRQMEEDVKRIEKLAAIGELAAGIAHEIRNPLASMSGAFQMLEEDLGEDVDHGRLLAIIRREMERLNHIVNDFLMFARPRSGSPTDIELSRLLEDIVRMLEQEVGQGEKIRIEKNIPADTHSFFDRHHLEQVMWNLLRNSVEAMPDGGVLGVSVHPRTPAPGMVTVAVSDTGGGISQENLSKIYDPFFTTREGGNGLGLSIVYRILQSGGGRIEVVSSEGSGTTFSVLLPMSASPAGA